MDVLAILEAGEEFNYETPSGLMRVDNVGLDKFTIYKAYAVIPNGSYTPSELGFDLPQCVKINVGICPHKAEYVIEPRPGFLSRLLGLTRVVLVTRMVSWSESVTNNDILGHVSCVVGQEEDHQMCIKDGKYVLSGPNTPTEIIWHEYGHIIAGIQHAHDETWVAAVTGLGQPARLCSGFMIL